jgi:hypothetical protein
MPIAPTLNFVTDTPVTGNVINSECYSVPLAIDEGKLLLKSQIMFEPGKTSISVERKKTEHLQPPRAGPFWIASVFYLFFVSKLF